MSNEPVSLGPQRNIGDLQNDASLKKRATAAKAAADAAQAAADAAMAAIPVKCTGAEIDAGVDDAKYATPKAIADSSLASIADVPVKASGAEVDTGTNDAKFLTPKALNDSKYLKGEEVWPIGSIFLSVVSTNPGTLLGFGTWTQISQGQFLVGQKGSDTDFDTAEETGGAKTVDISHTHKVNPPSTTTSQPDVKNYAAGNLTTYDRTNENHTHTVDIAEFDSGSGGSATLSILPPYFVVYIWKRTA